MTTCPVCGSAYKSFEVADSVTVQPGEEPAGATLCVAPYDHRDGSGAVRCYYHV